MQEAVIKKTGKNFLYIQYNIFVNFHLYIKIFEYNVPALFGIVQV